MKSLFKEGKHYKATFTQCEKPNRDPDFVSYGGRKFRVYDISDYDDDELEEIEVLKTPSEYEPYYLCRYPVLSSSYWYTEDGLYRESDHWGAVGKSLFILDGERANGELIVGYCPKNGFKKHRADIKDKFRYAISKRSKDTEYIRAKTKWEAFSVWIGCSNN